MSRVLIIESSARQQDSVSRQLTQTFISQWQAAHPQAVSYTHLTLPTILLV